MLHSLTLLITCCVGLLAREQSAVALLTKLLRGYRFNGVSLAATNRQKPSQKRHARTMLTRPPVILLRCAKGDTQPDFCPCISLAITASLPALCFMPLYSSGELSEQERDANAPRPATRAMGRARPAIVHALTKIPADPAEAAASQRPCAK